MNFLLYPFALLYGFGVAFRNYLYDANILKTFSYKVPVILAGNLSTGGTGKTPCVEHLVAILKGQYKVAVISRGYKRKSKGFQLADKHATWEDIGDEPLQIASRFPNITVAVDGNRRRAIENILHSPNPPEVIIMDDGFQHRKIKPAISILLTDYSKPFNTNYLLPVGNLREQKKNSKRANVIVVTKAPAVHSPISEKLIIKSINPEKHQSVFFSFIMYGKITPLCPQKTNPELCHPNTIIMVAGIANPAPMEQHLHLKCSTLVPITFPDHHQYTHKDYKKIIDAYHNQFSRNKIIVITEKDYYRMKSDAEFEELKKLNLCVLPIEVRYHTNLRDQSFETYILESVQQLTSLP